MSLLTHASYEINMQRRLLLKPDIGREYSALCSSQLPFTDLLFGDDPKKHLKDNGDQNKIGAKITPAHKGTRPYPVKSGYTSYKQPKTGKATVNDLGNTKVRGTGTTKPLAQASRAIAARY